MKWSVSQSRSACARQPLAQLLTDQLGAQEAACVTEHLDGCEECQQRLTRLSADPKWWREAGQWLENASMDDDLVEESIGEEYGEHQGPSPEECLLQSGLMRPTTKLEMIGSIGRYDVRRVIGTGGTGIVLQAVDTELDRVVAVKVLAPTFAGNGPARRRFSREGQAAAAVVHENVVAIHHVESNGPVPFLVMQFVDGCSLQEQITRVGPMDATSTLRIIAQLASALDAAHAQGLVHRDVKPANILVAAAGQRVWITDFGLARAVDDASLTRTGFIAGTPHYMSPEQARGETVGPGSDLFGLGSVMYFALTGRPPFRAERSLAILNRICSEKHRPVREVNPDVPTSVAAIVDRLLEKDSRCRYQTANVVRDECLQLLSHPESISESPIPRAIPKRPRSVLVGLLICLSALTVLAFSRIVFGAWNWHSIDSYVASPGTTDRQSKTMVPTRDQFIRRTSEPVKNKILQTMQTIAGNRNGSSSILAPQANLFQDPVSLPANLPTNLPAENSANNALQTVNPYIPSEQELWQTEFDALERELHNLRTGWIGHDSQSTPESSADSVQVSFDLQLSQLLDLFVQLEAPVQPIQNAPYVSY
ncbi:MAG: serine/threonine-protein kinase [Pirellula sp.]